MPFRENISPEFFSPQKKESQNEKIEKRESKEERLAKIEIVATRLKEKYKEYKNFSYFIDYLASVERISVLSEMEEQGKEEAKKSFIEAETHKMSLDSGIDKDIFDEIKNNFVDECESLEKIDEIADKLEAKHKDCSGCIDFIKYMKDFLMFMSDLSEESKEKIIKARIVMIADNSNGNPSLTILKEAYDEFKNELAKE